MSINAVSFASWFWRLNPPAPPSSAPRDLRVDFFRGFALVVIFIDHVSGNRLAALTPAALGFSDAAEAFVLLAGFSTALAYGLVMDRRGVVPGALQIGARVWKLYMAHIGLFIFMAVAVAAMAVKAGNPLYYEHVAILPFFQDPANAILQMATLRFLPNYLDILPLYIVLLAALPAIWALTRLAPVLALAASVALYWAVGPYELSLPNEPTGGTWFFNPFAWQLIFVVGVLVGHAVTRGVSLPRHPLLSLAALGMVAFALLNHAPWTAIPGLRDAALPDLWRVEPDKSNLSLWRFFHALALAYLVARYLPRDAAWLKGRFARPLVDAGKHSLAVFCVGVMLSLAGTFAFFEIGRDWPMQVVVNLVGIMALLLCGRALSWYKSLDGDPKGSAAKLPEAKTV